MSNLNLSGESAGGATEEIIHRYIAKDPIARAIVKSWRFKANRGTVIKTVSSLDFAAMIERNPVQFG